MSRAPVFNKTYQTLRIRWTRRQELRVFSIWITWAGRFRGECDNEFYRAQSTVFVYPRSMDRLRLIRPNPAGFDVFDGLLCPHWGSRHEVGAGSCQDFTNR